MKRPLRSSSATGSQTPIFLPLSKYELKMLAIHSSKSQQQFAKQTKGFKATTNGTSWDLLACKLGRQFNPSNSEKLSQIFIQVIFHVLFSLLISSPFAKLANSGTINYFSDKNNHLTPIPVSLVHTSPIF